MTDPADGTPAGAPPAAPPPVRRRDAARSRELLVRAAVELFADRGFERTTTREIGERAGVDPALIARYFGGKTQLYLAAVRVEQGDATPADLLDPERLRDLVERIDRRGPGPSFQAAVLPNENSEVQRTARGYLTERLVRPLGDRLTEQGADRAQLRAELAVAAFAGVVLARTSGAFEELAQAAPEELLPLLREVLGAVRPADSPGD
ncbi:TetR family transcriptional regulator [Kitasatospora sp. NBC_01287]|uniref:TetR/AcrR family transcriptional regulator n=1 Tax=Kitasatospora sp. NBC_01287 TaxID=2903573 RepID=UPI0022517679|nr:TetR/AcrR family transcriptional regulator [Kitasatospora sp. NBC_01287]MCX4744524.1 TetR family transcriptional regulator [Kitasatospora sp. NBC_01287]